MSYTKWKLNWTEYWLGQRAKKPERKLKYQAGWHRSETTASSSFIDLRDWSGRVQLVVNPENKAAFEVAKSSGQRVCNIRNRRGR
ncbi:MAG: hypothetical protein QY318_03805 [Candidatus Dojkabacteria bacterium]|nr:MAG: hypothetical protein QY318_03805 [Candidatus Dojkabacteria bacterium]